jgi:CRISPR-associated protein Cmx8
MSVTGTDATFNLAKRVHDLIARYVYVRTDARSPVKWDTFKDRFTVDPTTGNRRRDVPAEYREAREKVCADAFLAMRARRSREDFITYFTGTVCAVPQFLPEGEYAAFAAVLLSEDGWEEVKSLAMLALSGLSHA